LDLAPAGAVSPTIGPATPAGQLVLTPRQAEVLALMAAGRSNR
jgi:DNA-binding CsgD family transcriptional regulator